MAFPEIELHLHQDAEPLSILNLPKQLIMKDSNRSHSLTSTVQELRSEMWVL